MVVECAVLIGILVLVMTVMRVGILLVVSYIDVSQELLTCHQNLSVLVVVLVKGARDILLGMIIVS